MRILVTGGAGFIGSHLSERLLAEKHHVVCLDNFDPFYPREIKEANLEACRASESFELVEGDIRDSRLLSELFGRSGFDLVIHLAAKAGVRPSIDHPLEYHEVNVVGTLNVLEAARAVGVSRMVFASSSSVYGNNPNVPYSEKDNVDHPISPYASTKKSGELLCYTYHHLHKMDIFCFRFFTVYGPRQRPEMAIHKFTRLLHEGKPLQLFGDGSSSRDYTYIEDIVNGIVKSLDRLNGYEVLNLGESRTTTLLELVNLIGACSGKKVAVEFLPRQPGDVDQTYADISRAKDLLAYAPNTAIEDGIGKFVAWYRKIYS